MTGNGITGVDAVVRCTEDVIIGGESGADYKDGHLPVGDVVAGTKGATAAACCDAYFIQFLDPTEPKICWGHIIEVRVCVWI